MTMKNKPYTPIDCSFYDRIEAAIVKGKPLELSYEDEDGTTRTNKLLLVDTVIKDKQEFVACGSGQLIRMDRIKNLDGVEPPMSNNCALPDNNSVE